MNDHLMAVFLSGTIDKHSIEVTNCFSVPHNESEDEVWLINYLRLSMKVRQMGHKP